MFKILTRKCIFFAFVLFFHPKFANPSKKSLKIEKMLVTAKSKNFEEFHVTHFMSPISGC